MELGQLGAGAFNVFRFRVTRRFKHDALGVGFANAAINIG